MSAALTVDSLKSILGREVEEIHLTIAKSSVLGLDPEIIANTLGIAKSEIDELMETAEYRDIRLLVGAEQAKDRVERDLGWDGVENIAVSKLSRRVQLENDTDTLLRIAAVANRATRRTAPTKETLLDPSAAGARVPLTLTRRFTEKLNGSGQLLERSETQQISVLNGSAVNPTFKEVNALLQGLAQGEAPELPPPTLAPRTNLAMIEQTESDAEDDFSMAALKEMAKGIRGNG
jgi:hypothetical protein